MISFMKYHGCGNNFIICDYEEVKQYDFSLLALKVCDIFCGIGADGLIIVKKDPLEMIFYNQDGSRAPMCGNGIRCFGAYVKDQNICKENVFDVNTLAGIMKVHMKSENPYRIEIDMGKADYDISKLKLNSSYQKSLLQNYKYMYEEKEYLLSSVFMGTIHTVVFVDDVSKVDVEKIGKVICEDSLFSEKTNVNFVEIINKKNIKVITYERGVGITKACGTGCCASVEYAIKYGYCDNEVEVNLPLGKLKIHKEKEHLFMDGPAVKIAEGKFLGGI